ncbi:MAG: hypothetical protein MK213_09915 [Planctomycetes bacterium]|nr:hypothetical protein [Planctomycetota bacterium]
MVASSSVSAQEAPSLDWFGRTQASPDQEGATKEQEEDNPLEGLATSLFGPEITSGWAFDEAMRFGVLMEGVGEFSEADEITRLNRLRMRSMELHIDGVVESLGRAYLIADFSDGGNGGEFLLREAAAWLDPLTPELQLRVGRYYADVGAWNRTHVSDFPGINLDGVRRAFLGGQLAMTGVELHRSRDAGGLRWSLGLAGDVESQDPDEPGNGVSRVADTPGRTGMKHWAMTGRIEKKGDWLWGASLYYTPAELHRSQSGNVVELDTLLLEGDVRHTRDLGGGQWKDSSAEIWLRRGSALHGSGVDSQQQAFGFWGQYAEGWNSEWSGGLIASWWQHFGGLQTEGAFHSGYVECLLGREHRVRMSLSHTNPGAGEQKFFAVGLQWSLGFGEPRWTGPI